jgi:primosomal replication protein N
LNQLVLVGRIAEIGAMRHTPVGIPAVDMVLEHESEVQQAYQPRKIRATVKAVAFGAVAEGLLRQEMGSVWCFKGFVSTARNSKRVVFHIQDFQPIY